MVEINILPVNQPIGEFYVGTVKGTELFKICKADVRRLEEKDEIEKYIGIQRPLNESRVKEIKEYLRTFDASFPNSIIISLNSEFIESSNGKLEVQENKEAAIIIDGQHRLSAFSDEEFSNIDLIVTIFIDLSYEENALLFSTINTKQTKINQSLAKSLLEFSELNTPSKVAFNIGKKFHNSVNSPWYKKINIIGIKNQDIEPIITLKTFTEQIENLIYDSKDMYKIRNILKDKKKLELDYDKKTFIFWEFYKNGEEEVIYKILFNYFEALKENFHKEWVNPGYILCKTTGYNAFMRHFKDLFNIGYQENDLSKEFFSEKIKNSKQKLSGVLNSNNYASGKTGENKLFKELSKSIK